MFTETIEDATADLSYPKMKMDTTNELHIAYGDANANLKYVTGSSGELGNPVFVTGTNSSGGNPND
jgi:hypothetical protein